MFMKLIPGQQKTLLDAQVPGPRRVRRENGNSIIQLKKELNAKSEIFFLTFDLKPN